MAQQPNKDNTTTPPGFKKHFYQIESNRIKLYEEAVDLWGVSSQIGILLEEAIELALAVRKLERELTHKNKIDHNTVKKVCGEIADIEIMIEQICRIFPENRKHIERIKIYKLERVRKRIDAKDFDKTF